MTQLLEEAINQLRNLPQPDQDSMATFILAELADEQRWNAAFANSQDQLGKLAAKVREDIKAGRVRSGGIDQL